MRRKVASGRKVQRPRESKHIVKVLGKDCGRTGLAGAVSYTSSCPSRRLDHQRSRKWSQETGQGLHNPDTQMLTGLTLSRYANTQRFSLMSSLQEEYSSPDVSPHWLKKLLQQSAWAEPSQGIVSSSPEPWCLEGRGLPCTEGTYVG